MKKITTAVVLLIMALLFVNGGCGSAPETAAIPTVTVTETAAPAATPTTPTATASPAVTAEPEPTTAAPPKLTPEPKLTPDGEPPPPEPTDQPTVIAPDFYATLDNHFGFMPARWTYEGSRTAGGAWDRPFFELFQWGMIERTPGTFNWSSTDAYVRQANAAGLHTIANLQPFAKWDQEACHGDLPVLNAPGPPDQQSSRGKPCDMEAYRNFITRLIERYDGDGIDDMPGLTYPIKHWELMNEPEFQDMYFQGTPAEYVEVLIATSEAARAADPESLIVQGGMAGMMVESEAFFQGILDAGGGAYIDIYNMHSIGHGEHLNLPGFKAVLARNGLQDEPFWVTEVQYEQTFDTDGFTNDEFADVLCRSYVFALANGAQKLFHVNIKLPPSGGFGNLPFGEESALFANSGQPSAVFQAHRNIANLLGNLKSTDTVEIISETVGQWFITTGKYKFVMEDRTVYALFGTGGLPAEITGEITVIDAQGNKTVIDAAAVRLTASPIFILVE